MCMRPLRMRRITRTMRRGVILPTNLESLTPLHAYARYNVCEATYYAKTVELITFS